MTQEQEPVATVTSETGANITMSWWHEPPLPVGTKLYTHPPQNVIDKSAAIRIATALGWTPPRTWVGLTDGEIDQGLLRTPYAMKTAEAWREGVRWAYHQLKEKNT